MGWTINYEVEVTPGAVAPDAAALEAHLDTWNARLSTLCEPYVLKATDLPGRWRGYTRPAPSARAADDYVTLVHALAELEARFPGLFATISDEDGILSHARPCEIDAVALRRSMLAQWSADERELAVPESEDPQEALLQNLRHEAAAVGKAFAAERLTEADFTTLEEQEERQLTLELQRLVGAPVEAAPPLPPNVIAVDFKNRKKR